MIDIELYSEQLKKTVVTKLPYLPMIGDKITIDFTEDKESYCVITGRIIYLERNEFLCYTYEVSIIDLYQ